MGVIQNKKINLKIALLLDHHELHVMFVVRLLPRVLSCALSVFVYVGVCLYQFPVIT